MKKASVAAVLTILAALAVWWGLGSDSGTLEPPGGARPAIESTADPSAAEHRQPALEAPAAAGVDGARSEIGTLAPGALAASKLLLRLVDQRTGEPVPHLRVEVEGAGGEREALESDAQGRLESGRDYVAGLLLVHLVGLAHPDDLLQTDRRAAKEVPTSVRHEHAAHPAPADVAIPVGPTFPLRLTLPACYVAGDLLAIFTSADSRRAFDKLYSEVHDDGGAWVRFSPLASLVGGGPVFALHVGTRDGLWYGVAHTQATSGVQPPTSIELQTRGSVRGRVLGPDGEPVARQWVMMKPCGSPSSAAPTAEGATSPRTLAALTGADGAYQQRWMEPGPYSLKIEREGCRTHETRIDVGAGLETLVDIALEGDGKAREGAIRGRLTSTSGTYSSDVMVILVRPAEAGWNRTTRVDWKEEGGTIVGRFAFEGLADGEYVLGFHASDLAAVEPEPSRVRPTGEELAFLVNAPASGGSAALVFRVTDARTGEVLRAYEPYLELDRGTASRTGRAPEVGEDGRAVWPDYPVDTPFEYTVRCRGYRPAWGDDGDARTEGEALVVDVALEPGWGTKVVVLGSDDERLAGARVLFDGVEAGTTDGRGELRVALDGTPRRVRVELPGWRMAEEGSEPDGIAFREWSRFLSVRMRRE